MSSEVAKSIIEQITGQIKLLFSLSTGICGAIMASLLQVSFRNNDPDKPTFILRGLRLIILAFAMEGVSILFGYLAQGAVISLTPSIYRVAGTTIENWTVVQFSGGEVIRFTMLFQFIFFFFGIIILLFTVMKNLDTVNKRSIIEVVRTKNFPK